MKKLLMAIGFALILLVSCSACSSTRPSSPSSPSGENWASQKATHR